MPDAFGVKCMGDNLIAEDIHFASGSNISCHEKALLKTNEGTEVNEMSDLVLILVSVSVAAVILMALFMTVCVFRAKIKVLYCNFTLENFKLCLIILLIPNYTSYN